MSHFINDQISNSKDQLIESLNYLVSRLNSFENDFDQDQIQKKEDTVVLSY